MARQHLAQIGYQRARLEAFANGLNALSGQFTQTTSDANGEVQEESHGTLALAAPRQFRWQYEDPFPQLIVADGNDVYACLDVTQLASRRDAVFAITGKIPDTVVPDSLLALADEIVFVDERPAVDISAPIPDVVPRSYEAGADHYIALRSLALRCLEAARATPEPDLAASTDTLDVAVPASTVLAVLSSADDSDKIVRAAARLAAQLNANWQTSIKVCRLMLMCAVTGAANAFFKIFSTSIRSSQPL